MKRIAILDETRTRVTELRTVPDDTMTRPGATLPVILDPMPPYDHATQRLEPGEPVIVMDPVPFVRETWAVVPKHPPGPVYVDALDFMDRITPQEWEGLEGMAQLSADVRHAIRRLYAAQQIDLRDPLLPVLFSAAVAAGVLALNRPQTILALP